MEYCHRDHGCGTLAWLCISLSLISDKWWLVLAGWILMTLRGC